MRRTILIASGLTLLCLAVLIVWISRKRNGSDDVRVPEANIDNGWTSNKSARKKTPDPRVYELPVNLANLGDDKISVCYVDTGNMTLYPWKGVVLQYEQLPEIDRIGTTTARRSYRAKDFTAVVPIEALVKYWYWEEGEGYRPGHLDRSARAFYAWKGIVLNKEEVPDKSSDGKAAIIAPDKVSQVIEIDMPTHLKEQPELWKKGGAYTSEASIRAEKRAAEKKASEKRAAEERARAPQVFTLDVWVTTFGENEFSPCYYDPKNRSLYRWKGVILRLEQLPEVYRKRQKVLGDVRAVPLLVVPVEAPVKYRQVNEEYRPGYLDPTCRTFYEWKGVALSKQELLDKSKDGQDAVVKPDKFSQVIEIDMPAYLKEQPRLWKKP